MYAVMTFALAPRPSALAHELVQELFGRVTVRVGALPSWALLKALLKELRGIASPRRLQHLHGLIEGLATPHHLSAALCAGGGAGGGAGSCVETAATTAPSW